MVVGAIAILSNAASAQVPGWLQRPIVLAPAIAALVLLEEFLRRQGTLTPSQGYRLLDAANRERVLARTADKIAALQGSSIDQALLAKYGLPARIPLSFSRTDPKAQATVGGIPPQDLPRDGSVIAAQQLIDEIVWNLGGISALVVGDSGAGKTTFLLDLALETNQVMRERYEAGKPHILPVWLDLSSWTTNTSFQGWLEHRIGLEYRVSRQTIRQWIEEDALFVILDNYSWLPQGARSHCVAELGAFAEGHPGTGLLLAANDEMIRPFVRELGLTVLQVQEPTVEELRTCLEQFQRSHSTLVRAFRSSSELVEAMQSRIFVAGALLAFGDRAPTHLDPAAPAQTIQARLIEGLVSYMLERRDRVPPVRSPLDLRRPQDRVRFREYLSWIAALLARHGEHYFKDSFFVGDLPDGPERRRLRVGLTGLTFATNFAIFGLGTWLLFGSTAGWIAGVVIAVPWTLFVFVSLPMGGTATDGPARGVRWFSPWSWDRFVGSARRNWYISLILLAMCTVPPVQWSFTWDRLTSAQRQSGLALLAIAVGMTAAAVWGMGTEFLVEKDEPWTGTGLSPSEPGRWVARSVRWAGIITLSISAPLAFALGLFWIMNWGSSGLTYANRFSQFPVGLLRHFVAWGEGRLIVGPLSGLISEKAWPLVIAAVVGLTCGLWFLGLSLGGLISARISQATLVHQSLVPRNYLSFLDHAVQLSLLQRFGGGEYAFSHQLVRDHFIQDSQSLLSERRIGFTAHWFERWLSRHGAYDTSAVSQPSPAQHVEDNP